jgi:acetolactate synthase I/II/III large subunit
MAHKGNAKTKAHDGNAGARLRRTRPSRRKTRQKQTIRTFTTPTRLTGAEIIWATLVGEGVDTVFGYPGGAILPAYDALRKFPIRHVLVRHEQGAAHMADGYARASGKVGVAIATSGPGRDQPGHRHCHGDARFDSHRLHHRQRVEQAAGHRRVSGSGHHRHHAAGDQAQFSGERAEDIAPTIRHAFQIARSGRPGPVLVDITKDAQQATAEFDFEAAKPRRIARIPCCTWTTRPGSRRPS